MKPIRVAKHRYRTHDRKKQSTYSHALARRMTNLQLAVLELIFDLRTEDEAFIESLFSDERVPIYYCTGLGELTSVMTIAKSVYKRELPCSPAAFQHSVHNAAAGYIASTHKTRNPNLTFSTGFLTFDLATLYAAKKIDAGMIDGVILINGAEVLTSKNDLDGEAEVVILLSSESKHLINCKSPNGQTLKDIRYLSDGIALKALCSDLPPLEKTETLESTALSPMVPLTFLGNEAGHIRIMKAQSNEAVVSIWSDR